MVHSPIVWLLGLLVTTRLLLSAYRTFTSPLRDIPGPVWARFTKLWYFNRVRQANFEQENITLHEKHDSSIVRLAPNHYSVSDPAAVRSIYGTGSKFTKSDWYEGWKHPSPDRWQLFTERNIKRHTETRKRFTSLYSMSSLIGYEEFVDSCADIFTQRLAEVAARNGSLNMGHWFQCYAFDVIASITYGDRFGFLNQGQDIEGTMAALHKILRYSTLIGIYPQLHFWFYETLSRFSWSGAGGRAYIMRFVQEKIRNLETKRDLEESIPRASNTQTFVEKMLLARDKDPEKVTNYHVFMMGLSNVIAGSDTTASSLSGVLYHLLRNQEVLAKLRQEIDSFTAEGRCSERPTFKESQDMPYLQAVIKEGMRMHSATGLPLWRVVPEGGAEISGRFFPAGTVVGINTWVAHYNEDIFPDANVFRPERWIEAESTPERLKMMNDMYMPFGLGSRTCIGKHISILEMSKLIPRLIRDFQFHMKEWHTQNFWFVKPTKFEVQVQKRS